MFFTLFLFDTSELFESFYSNKYFIFSLVVEAHNSYTNKKRFYKFIYQIGSI